MPALVCVKHKSSRPPPWRGAMLQLRWKIRSMSFDRNRKRGCACSNTSTSSCRAVSIKTRYSTKNNCFKWSSPSAVVCLRVSSSIWTPRRALKLSYLRSFSFSKNVQSQQRSCSRIPRSSSALRRRTGDENENQLRLRSSDFISNAKPSRKYRKPWR